MHLRAAGAAHHSINGRGEGGGEGGGGKLHTAVQLHAN